jgi:hypothetical protein
MDKELIALVIRVIKQVGYEIDNDGQVLVYSGLYEWDDGSINEAPQHSNTLQNI